jgi:hypothetical protein
MSETDSIVGTQLDALLKLLEHSRRDHCREVLEKAALQADEIRQRARKQAREKIRQAVREERDRMDNEVRMVEAEIETEQRRRGRQRDLALITSGSNQLAAALQTRWENPDHRRQWSIAALGEAAAVLRSRDWSLEHPADLAEDERNEIMGHARSHYQATVKARSTEAFGAGIRIHCQGVLIDMSIPGLLANESSIEGELLAEFNRAAEEKSL